MGISRVILVTGLQILENFPCGTGELMLYYIHRLMMADNKNWGLVWRKKKKKKKLLRVEITETQKT